MNNKRIKKRSARVAGMKRCFPLNDLVVAIGLTVVLTTLVIVLGGKVYWALLRRVSLSSSSGKNKNENGSSNKNDDHHPQHGNQLPYNPRYVVPGSHPDVGDRSDAYVTLRERVDRDLPHDPTRSLRFVQDSVLLGNSHRYAGLPVAAMDVHHSDTVPYDVYDCPLEPPAGYPFAWRLRDVLANWSPDVTEPPPTTRIHHGLCVFDHATHYRHALAYRDAELPFVVANDPDVAAAVERWNQPGYLRAMLGDVRHRCEYSENNHFMYYTPVSQKQLRAAARQQQQQQKTRRTSRLQNNVPADWKAPTQMMRGRTTSTGTFA
jgi:hypothetical protein